MLGKSVKGICAKDTTGSQTPFLENLTSSGYNFFFEVIKDCPKQKAPKKHLK